MLSILQYVYVAFACGITSAQKADFIKVMLGMSDGSNGVDDLEFAYSPPTAVEQWVLATGNDSAIAALWSALALDGGRIVSDGDFHDATANRWRHYGTITINSIFLLIISLSLNRSRKLYRFSTSFRSV